MIAVLTGNVFDSTKSPLILMVGGVGYGVHVPPSLLGKVKTGEKIILYTYTHVREDSLELFGFATPEDKTLFELLLSVSGIGPKTALLVSAKGTTGIMTAIQTSDVSFFTGIPRLGRKNAQKIIIELKSKIGSLNELNLSDTQDESLADVREALETMGFAKREITAALSKMDRSLTDTKAQIRAALKLLSHA